MGIYIDLDDYSVDPTGIESVSGILWLNGTGYVIFVTPEKAKVVSDFIFKRLDIIEMSDKEVE